MVASCATCQENRHKNPALPLYPARIPDHPFQLVSVDIFQFARIHYLLLVDGYSKWPCLATLRSLSSAATIEALDDYFADFGAPEELTSDNRTQFVSVEFNRFCDKRGVRHVTSSPEFPQLNGLTERHIQTVKAIMWIQDRCTLLEVLAAVPSTPVSDQLPAPSVLLLGWNVRGSLLFSPEKLVPRCIPASFVQLQLRSRQGEAAFHATRRYDVRSSFLFVGQTVRARIGSRWLSGVVEEVCREPNSYRVKLVDGCVFRRTQWAINAVQVPTPSAVTSTHFFSLRFPDVGGDVLSSAAVRQQEPTGVEPVTRVPPSSTQPRGSPFLLTTRSPSHRTFVTAL